MALQVKIEFNSQLDLVGEVLEGRGWASNSTGNSWVVFTHADKGNVIVCNHVADNHSEIVVVVQPMGRKPVTYEGRIWLGNDGPVAVLVKVTAWVNNCLVLHPNL